MINADFAQRVWLVIAVIPKGWVVTYGDVARMAGAPRSARHVGRVLRQLPAESQLPWHRVINQQGYLSLQGDAFIRQRDKLREEGIEVSSTGRLTLARWRWQPE